MKFFIVQLLVAAAVAFVATSAETIQLQPSQGILIPAPIAEALRIARSAYGAAPAPSYSAPAPAPSYSAPAPAPSYSAPAPAPSYSAPAPAPSYSAPAPAPVSIPAPPCANNYLFSCQPALTPVPCSSPAPAPSYSAPAPAPSYSAPAPAPAQSYSAPQGSYSQYVPQYAVPVVREVY